MTFSSYAEINDVALEQSKNTCANCRNLQVLMAQQHVTVTRLISNTF